MHGQEKIKTEIETGKMMMEECFPVHCATIRRGLDKFCTVTDGTDSMHIAEDERTGGRLITGMAVLMVKSNHAFPECSFQPHLGIEDLRGETPNSPKDDVEDN
ncbi:hypothetical protein RRG08_021619 [Elysia crispata]|uniref:Uncharacterized protein n=1 Tax=Elysia crispata TaxID=231223 RepID=A0AAE0XDS2_9GAST|nr:hypothetical protein RRG08_021619 [Elysia crispata]